MSQIEINDLMASLQSMGEDFSSNAMSPQDMLHSSNNNNMPNHQLQQDLSLPVSGYHNDPVFMAPFQTPISPATQQQPPFHHQHSLSLPSPNLGHGLSLNTSHLPGSPVDGNSSGYHSPASPHSGYCSSPQRQASPNPAGNFDNNLLVPPSPHLERRRSFGHSRRHAHTFSEGSVPFLLTTAGNPDTMYLGADILGPGLHRNKSAPSTALPYARPPSREPSPNRFGAIDIPNISNSNRHSRNLSGPVGEMSFIKWGEEHYGIPASAKPGSSPGGSDSSKSVATEAMKQAAAERRRNPARFQCTMCDATFTAENSRKRKFIYTPE